MQSTLATFAAVGYSRCLRWILAVIPALKMLVLDPLTAYFFNHLDGDVGLIHYAESVGMLTPQRRSGSLCRPSGAHDAPHLASTGVAADPRYLFHRQVSNHFNTSSVGLSVDASPYSSRHELLSMTSTDGSQTDGATDMLSMEELPWKEASRKSDHTQRPYPDIPMKNSPQKNNRSVHFDLFDESG